MSDQSIHKKGLAPGWWVAIAVAIITVGGGITEAVINGYFSHKPVAEAKPPITFAGRVFDEANSPIVGATVFATQDQNPGQGIRTDTYGQFQIEVAPETKVLLLGVSAVGFVTKSVQADIHRTGAEPIQLQRVPQPSSQASTPETPANPCPYGQTVLNNVEAVNNHPDKVKSTGFYFDGPNPCVTINHGKSKGNQTGYRFNVVPSTPVATSAKPTPSLPSGPTVNGGISQHDCGVVQMGGQGNVAAPTCAPPERQLRDEQKKAISDALKGKQIIVHVGYMVNVPDAQDYANELCDAIKEGIPATDCGQTWAMVQEGRSASWYGVEFVYKGDAVPVGTPISLPPDNPASILMKALVAAGLNKGAGHADPSAKEGEVLMIIGRPPPQ